VIRRRVMALLDVSQISNRIPTNADAIQVSSVMAFVDAMISTNALNRPAIRKRIVPILTAISLVNVTEIISAMDSFANWPMIKSKHALRKCVHNFPRVFKIRIRIVSVAYAKKAGR
jgi:hypothetical protein